MLEARYQLRPKERKMYTFLWEHGALVEELNEVMDSFRKVLETCKERDLSKKSAKERNTIIHQGLMSRGDRLTRLGEMMLRYFAEDVSLENNRIADVKVWERKTLPANLVAKRVRILSQAT